MKLFTFAVALLLSLLPTSSYAQTHARTWITNVTIISPEKSDPIATGSVLIDDGRIARIQAKAPSDTAGATVVNGKGKFLIPGLIDSHVHLAVVPGMDPAAILLPGSTPPEMVAAYYRQLPRSYLYFGYTTVVDLAVIDKQPLDEFRHAALHPDLYDCGPSLPIANGYPTQDAPPKWRFKLFPNFIYDPRQASSIPPEYKPADHTPAADVARDRAAGAICVKTYFERGFGANRNLPVLTPEMAREVRQAATKDGLVMMMHANSFEAQTFAVSAGVDVIAHGMWNWGDLNRQPDLPPEIKALLDRIISAKIGYQPTMQVMQGLRAYFDPEYLNLPVISKVVPAELLAWYRTPEGNWFKKELVEDNMSDAEMRAGFDSGPIRRGRQVVGYLAPRNANFLFGTDTPSAPTYGNLPGLNGYLEMRRLHEAGLSLSQILQAATISNAREFKLDSQLGTIEPGKIANLLLLTKSPLETIDAYDTIEIVWIHGKQAQRESLAANAPR